ncbi:unnamed protein product [Amaranthus hypochondriacus]
MAPSGRRHKPGLRRMDAAIEALTPMGFTPNQIKRRVNTLLKLYDGGWVFIEDSAYKVLIDSLLEDEEGVQSEAEEPVSSRRIRDSPLDNRHQCIEETEPSPAEPLRVEASQAAQLGIEASEAEPSQAGSSQSKTSPVHLLHAGASQADPSQAKPLQAEPLQAGAPHEGSRPKKRKFCLGWLGPMDEEDYVLLEPAPVRSWITGQRLRKRKSGWDMKPDDPWMMHQRTAT